MSMLRSKLESRINLALNETGNHDSRRELDRILELVKNGEMILQEMSQKIESARFLEEFVLIMDSALSSVSSVQSDLEQIVPAAEAALEQMHDAISKVSSGVSAELKQEILTEAETVIAAGSASIANNDAKEQIPPLAEVQEEERVPA